MNNTIYEKLFVLLAGIAWTVISWNTYISHVTSTTNGGELLLMLIGSFALGWVAHHVWHKDSHLESLSVHNDVHQEKKTVDLAVVAPVAPQSLPVATYAPIGRYAVYEENDLQIVEGIGPKIDELFKTAGINTWKELADTPTEKMSQILTEAGPRFQFNNPKTWGAQAKLAHEGKWKELEDFQDGLIGGL